MPTQTVLDYVAAEAGKVGFIKKIVLFGSRARGDERPFSDYNLAVELSPDAPILEYLAFNEKLDDEAPTLCELTLIRLRDWLRPELLERIAKEGVTVYAR